MIESRQGTGAGSPAANPSALGSAATEPRAKQPGYVPDEDDKQIIQRVNARIAWNQREATRWALERQIFEIYCFACGNQWIEYSESSHRFGRWNAPGWFPTPVDNKIAPAINLMAAALLRSEPEGRVRANTNEARDREAAKVAESINSHIYSVTREDVLRHTAAYMAALGGTVVAEDYFDPTAGKILRIPRMQMVRTPMTEPAATCASCGIDPVDAQYTGLPCPSCQAPMTPGTRPRTLPDGTPMTTSTQEPELDEMGQPVVDEFPEGEIVSRVRAILNFYWDPKAATLDEARWCGEAVYADLDWIDEHFPEKGPFVGMESGIDGASFYEASILALVGPSMQGAAHYGGMTHMQSGAVLRKYQEKPSKKHPHGVHAIVADGVVLYKGALPLKDENGATVPEFGYSEFRYDMIPGRFPGRTAAEDMIPRQRAINGILSQIVLNRKTLLSPWIMAPKGSGMNPGQVAMRPGAVVLYNTIGVATSPQVVQGTPLPAQIYEELQQAVQAISDLARDAAMAANAQIPPGMRSGISMYFLKEQNDELGLPRLKRWGQWIATRDRKRLLLAQQHYREPRAIKILGEGSDYQIRYWKGADIAGNTDVSIDPGSLIPRSKSIRTQVIFDAVEAGLIDPQHPVQRQRLIEALDLSEFDTEIGPDWRRAKKENALMDDGQMVPVNPFDEHQIHKVEHLSRIKDPSFDSLPPAAKQCHLRHLQMHSQAEEQAQQQAMQDQLKEQRATAQLEASTRAASHGQVAPTIPDPDADLEAPDTPPGGEPGVEPGAEPGAEPVAIH